MLSKPQGDCGAHEFSFQPRVCKAYASAAAPEGALASR
jgi:hypothetical protein